jgi:hypothetical protein
MTNLKNAYLSICVNREFDLNDIDEQGIMGLHEPIYQSELDLIPLMKMQMEKTDESDSLSRLCVEKNEHFTLTHKRQFCF